MEVGQANTFLADFASYSHANVPILCFGFTVTRYIESSL